MPAHTVLLNKQSADTSGKRARIMNRRSLVLFGAACFLVASAGVAAAARLPVSSVTVNILSVDRLTYSRDDYHSESFKPGGASRDWYEEKTTYVAKARIEIVSVDDHHLTPGTIIDIHYEVPGGSAPIYTRTPPLDVKTGERWTLDIWNGYDPPAGGTSFQGRGWKRAQPDTGPSSISGGP
jgi:hypothetical protein